MIRILISVAEQFSPNPVTPPGPPIPPIPPVTSVTIIASLILTNISAGDIVSVFSVSGASGVFTYTLTSNPSNFFSISGSNLVVAILPPLGNLTIGVRATNGTVTVTQNFILTVQSVAAGFQLGQRPFLASSPANTLLPAGTPQWPILWEVSTGFNYIAKVNTYIDFPDVATAPVLVTTSPPGLGWPAATVTTPMTFNMNGSDNLRNLEVHINGDNEAQIVIGNIELDLWELYRNPDQVSTSSPLGAYAYCDIVNTTGMATVSQAKGVVASLCSNMFGILTKEELTAQGAWNHVAVFCGVFSQVNTGHGIAPWNVSNDGFSEAGQYIEGNILTFPTGMAMPASVASNPYGPALWNTIVNYGMVCVDRGGATQYYLGCKYNQTQAASSIPYADPLSWNATDQGHLIALAGIMFPLMVKTGFVMDGFAGPSGPMGTLISFYGPQTKFNGHLANTMMVVTRDSDSASSNIASNGTVNGLLDSVGLANFCAATVGRATQLANQLGTGNLISSGAAVPIIFQSGVIQNINGIPAPVFNGTSNYYKQSATSTLWPGASVYMNAVFMLTDLLADYYIFGSDASGGLALKISATTGIPVLCTNTGALIGQPFCSITAGAVYEIGVRHTPGASWSMQINASGVGSGTTAVTATAGNFLVGQAGPTATGFFKGQIADISLTSATPNLPQYSVENGLKAFYAPVGAVTQTHNTVVSDTFTDANGTNLATHVMDVGNGWTNMSGTYFIQSNTAQPNTLVSAKAFATFTPLSSITTGSPLANGVLAATLTPTASGSNEFLPGLIFRLTNITNYYILQLDPVGGVARVSVVNAGAGTTIATSTVPIVAGTPYTVSITMYFNSVTFSVNGETPILLSIINTAFNNTATLHGIRSSLSGSVAACSFDNLTFTT